jgi:hypothetical protein
MALLVVRVLLVLGLALGLLGLVRTVLMIPLVTALDGVCLRWEGAI